MRRLPLLLPFGLAALASCSSPRPTLDQLAPPEVVLDTLPRDCAITVDGADRGQTPLVFKAANREAVHTIGLSRDGFLPASFTLSGEEVAKNTGSQVIVYLRPGTWDAKSKAIDPNDPVGIARAGQDLGRANRCNEAVAYLERALEMDPRLAPAHKSLGICYAKQNRNKLALEQYKAYLMYAPEAPDAAKVRAIVDKAQGDIDLSPRKTE